MPDIQLLDSPLLRQDEGDVAFLTMNRPSAYNALSSGLMQALQSALDGIASERSVKAVVLAGSGQGFCAGHDLKELRSGEGESSHERLFAQCSELMLSIQRLPIPVIARIHGIATAAGCQLVASCDLAVASDNAVFATPGVNIGLFCSTPMVAVSRNIPRKRIMEMLLTGESISAAQAVEFGLINQAVPPDRLDEAVSELARKITCKSPRVLAIGKEAFYRQVELPVEEAYSYTSSVMVRNMMTEDAEEGISAFIEKRSPVWKDRRN
ncbi:MAG: enoyl-CoA hydratase [Rhodobacteraceae bacterium]|nr:enoyl-CoA hydratase [Paracoccaceae bacterium]